MTTVQSINPFENAIWIPQPGPQVFAFSCPATIVLFGGSRGGGKTDCSIGRQIDGALKYGPAWSGLYLRRNYKDFKELRRRIDELIRKGLPAERVGSDTQSNHVRFKNGAQILITAIENEAQLDFFQGQQFTEISIEEGCQFAFFDAMIEKLKGCLRSPHGIECHMFITANPGGPGHNQVKARFRLGKNGAKPGTIFSDGEGITTVFIPSFLDDNRILCEKDPKYVARLRSIKDPKLRKMWLEGDWDVVSGGFFDDTFDIDVHVLSRFLIPPTWDRIVGLDWGTARPFSVGWYAVSDGSYIPELKRALPRGALVRYREWYGCVKGEVNKGLRLDSVTVSRRIRFIEDKYGESEIIFDRIADPAIFKEEDGPSIAEKMTEEGVVFRRADNKRIPGWDEVRSRLRGHISADSVQEDGVLTIENISEPMLYVTENCEHFIRTIPVLSRDNDDWDDIDTDQEDHIADEVRYVCMSRPSTGAPKNIREREKTPVELDHEEICRVDYNNGFSLEDFDDPRNMPLQ